MQSTRLGTIDTWRCLDTANPFGRSPPELTPGTHLDTGGTNIAIRILVVFLLRQDGISGLTWLNDTSLHKMRHQGTDVGIYQREVNIYLPLQSRRASISLWDLRK